MWSYNEIYLKCDKYDKCHIDGWSKGESIMIYKCIDIAFSEWGSNWLYIFFVWRLRAIGAGLTHWF
jgi:hypothetical protein